MGIFSFLKKGRTFQDGTFVKPFTDREKKAARARFEKQDRLADKALRPFLGSFNVESPRSSSGSWLASATRRSTAIPPSFAPGRGLPGCNSRIRIKKVSP